MSNITLNIVEPGSGPVVPNTGLFTSSIGGPEITTISISAVLILTMVAIIITALLYRKQKKSGKVTKLVHLVDSTKAVLKSKKRITVGLSAIALLASAGTLTTLLASTNKNNTNAVEEDGLTLDVTGGDITIEVADEPVFAILPVELTVEEATEAGYTLTAFAEDTNLVSATDSSKVIPMVAADEGELTNLNDNTYGLSLVKPETKADEVYTSLSTDQSNPTFITDKDYEHTEANDTTTIYYGFYITPDVPYGTYTGTNIYYNVEPHYITNLSFDGNGNDGGEKIESRIIPAGDTITLPKNTYTKEGYNFLGWNTVAEPTEQDPGKTYEDQADFTAVEGETKDVTLYAQWKKLPVIGDFTYMQDFAKLSKAEKTSVLNSMTEGAEYQLEDNRDQTMYYIAKLADGNIWMTQNLDLDLISDPTAEKYVALTPANTNISSNWIPSSSTIVIEGTSVPGWQNSATTPYSADPGDVFYYSSGTSSNDEPYSTLEACKAVHPDCSMKNHVGNYYNWSAAVAMSDTSGYGDDDRYVNVKTSICPAGWRLPTGRQSDDAPLTDNELGTLVNDYDILGKSHGCGGTCVYYDYAEGGFNKIRTAPLWLARSGGVNYGSLDGTGSYGDYWSSTVSDSNSAYYLDFNSGNVGPTSGSSRFIGYSVRCVAQ